MMKLKLISIIILLFIFSNCFAQEKKLTVANWNLENLFDIADDPETDDQEFLPSSAKEWNQEKLTQKFKNLSKVIMTMKENSGPDILGVEEVEHKALLDSLVQTYLSKEKYKVAYSESPDNRGIDCGLIYNSQIMEVLEVSSLYIKLPDNYPTRTILCVTLSLYGHDTIVVYVNHWPSRRGGLQESEDNRIAAAKVLRKSISEKLKLNPDRKIVAVGDFNDEPENKSLYDGVYAKGDSCSSGKIVADSQLVNLAYNKSVKDEGSYLYQQTWNMLDQIIVSGGLYKKYNCNSFEVFKPEFLLTKSGKFMGAAYPTYGGGNRYLGGYSDHLPVVADFTF
jgi:endonuclease/exonuclease/phosphatase family metal-dependent hydrolase